MSRLVTRLARQRHLCPDVPPCPRKLARQCLGPFVLLLQRLLQLRLRALGSLLQLRRLGARLVRQGCLRLGVTPRRRQLARQRLGPVVLLLQRLSQLRRRALGGLLELRRLGARLARQGCLRLGITPRRRQFARQRLGPVVLLLQRLSQLRRRALGCLLELRCLVARLARQRRLRFNVTPRPRQLARQCLGPVVFLPQRLSQLRHRALGGLPELRRLVARLVRQRHLRLDDLLRLRQLARQGLCAAPLRFRPHRLRTLAGLRSIRPRVLARDPGLLLDGLHAGCASPDAILLTGGSRHIAGDLGAEIPADERCSDHDCGDRGNCKLAPGGRSAPHFARRGPRLEPGDSERVRLRHLTKCNVITSRRRPLGRRPARGERQGAALTRRRRAARSTFLLQKKFIAFLQKIFVAPRCMPIRRRDLAWLPIFLDPRTRVSRPVSELKGSTGVILENDDFPILRYGFDRTAHVKDAYFDPVIQIFLGKTSRMLRPYSTPSKASR